MRDPALQSAISSDPVIGSRMARERSLVAASDDEIASRVHRSRPAIGAHRPPSPNAWVTTPPTSPAPAVSRDSTSPSRHVALGCVSRRFVDSQRTPLSSGCDGSPPLAQRAAGPRCAILAIESVARSDCVPKCFARYRASALLEPRRLPAVTVLVSAPFVSSPAARSPRASEPRQSSTAGRHSSTVRGPEKSPFASPCTPRARAPPSPAPPDSSLTLPSTTRAVPALRCATISRPPPLRRAASSSVADRHPHPVPDQLGDVPIREWYARRTSGVSYSALVFPRRHTNLSSGAALRKHPRKSRRSPRR